MKNNFRYLLLIILSYILISCNNKDVLLRQEKSFDRDWYFSMGEEADSKGSKIEIPHIPRIEPLLVNDQWQGTMWYKKEFSVSSKENKYFLKFEGVMHEAELWLNNQKIATHAGGYLPFVVDISDHLNYDAPNEIKLRVNNEDNPQIPPGKALKVLDFNSYGGIYRIVTLIQTQALYITDAILENKPASGGILVHFDEVSDKKASGFVKVHVRNDSREETELSCTIKLTDPKGKTHSFQSQEIIVGPGKDAEIPINIVVHEPMLWSVSNPSLYAMGVQLKKNTTTLDQQVLNIGIRSIELKNDGFYLNGERLFIRGTNRHQEYPYVGYAISENADWRDVVKIKQAGFDFVRLSHYPHSESFLDACDKYGLLVMDAIPGWQFFGDSVFIQNSYQDIRDMVRRDRNHPSVIFWEVSLNESGMSEEYMYEANEILKKELPFDDTYSSGWIDHESYDLYIPARQHAKPPSYWNEYKIGERPILIAEYGDWEYYAQNAGFNQADFGNLKEEERSSRQLRAHGEKRLLQQALNYQEATNSNRSGGSNIIGHANWLMFDYNRGYADDLEASGIMDIFRIPKFAFYFYQSQRPADDTLAVQEGAGPMVKIASYWTAESNKEIIVYSNCQEVSLSLNDSLIEKRKPTIDNNSDHLNSPPFHFKLDAFQAGSLKAVGYINGKAVTEDIVTTPGKATKLNLQIDKSTIELSETASDLVFVYAEIVDTKGTLCPLNENEINFSLEGAGELIGTNPVKAEAGIATILLKTQAGANFKVKAESGGLETAGIELD